MRLSSRIHYHASKSLTVTAGVRWDIFGGRNERYNRLEYFDPACDRHLQTAFPSPALRSTSTAAIAPPSRRICTTLGLAWVSPGSPSQHFVVRGGAGFYYGPSLHNVG